MSPLRGSAESSVDLASRLSRQASTRWSQRGRGTRQRGDRDGASLGCRGAACRPSAGHWSPTFSGAQGISESACARVMCFAWILREPIEVLGFDPFSDVARRVRHCSPGPYGVPYYAWVMGRGLPLRVLYSVYLCLSCGVCPPAQFNDALLTFTPKGVLSPAGSSYSAHAPQLMRHTLSNSA